VPSLTDLLSFLDVLLRGAILSGQALVLGGLVFGLLILLPLARRETDPAPFLRPTLRLAALGAAGVAAAQALSLILQTGSLADERGWPLSGLIRTPFLGASLVRVVAALGVIAACRFLVKRPRAGAGWAALTGLALALVGGSAWLSHAAARLESRGVLIGLDALHQIAAAVWVGGLVHLFAATRRAEGTRASSLLRRFSAVAVAAVAILLAGGLTLSLYYVDGILALLGTAYGWMLLAKGVLLAALLLLGGLNLLSLRQPPPGAEAPRPRLLRWLVEAEIGLAVTALFVAASLTSLPPSVDVVADRATLSEVATRFTPQWPTLRSPPLTDLPIADPAAPRTAADISWSQFNHHWSGLFVLAMGLLALLERTRRAPWARHWPLLFLGLAAFLFARSDPGDWPLGPKGFWEGLASVSVLQHRFFAALTVTFGVFEWMVRRGRLRSPRWALVFPLLSAVAGALLLVHSHALTDLKAEFLVEATHIPLGLLAIFVGWARWLEVRLSPPDNRAPGWLWTVAFTLIGVLLLLYREG
jgi:putative copper resistance protein D